MKLQFVKFILMTLVSCSAQARLGFDYAASGSGSSLSHDVGASYSVPAGYSEKTGENTWLHRFSYSYGREKSKVSLNNNFSDFEIDSIAHGFDYGLVYQNSLQLSLGVSRRNFNNQEAIQNSASASLAYAFSRVQIGISGTNSLTYQNQDVVLLTRNFKDDIKFNRAMISYFIDAELTDSLNLFLSYTNYSYDENLDNMYALLTTTAFLNRNTASMASEAGAQLKKSYDLGFNYALNDSWLVNISYTAANELLSPQSLTETISAGADFDTYFDDFDLRFFGSVSSSKTEGSEERQGSLSLGVGLEF